MKPPRDLFDKPGWFARLQRGIFLLLAWSLPTSLFGMQAGVILGALALLGWGLYTRFQVFERTPLDLPFLTLLCAVGLSLLLAPGGATSFRLAASFWVWIAFYVVCFGLDTKKTLKWSVHGLLILSALAAAFGIYQSYTGHYPLGTILHPQLKAILKPVFGQPGRYAAVGLFFSRVTFAHLLLFPFCWFAAFLLEPFRWRVRLTLGAGFLLLWVGLTCTWTRSALAAAVLAAVGLLMTRLHRGKARLVAAVLLLVLVGALSVGLAPGLLQKTEKSFAGVHDWGRLTIWQTALDLASRRPVVGVGYGNFKREAEPVVQERMEALGGGRFAGVLTWAHNDLLTFLAECGLLGAFGWVWLFVAYFRGAGSGLRRIPSEDIWSRALVRGSCAAAGAFLFTSMFHDNFFHGELAFILFFSLGASLAAIRLSAAEGQGEGR